MNEKEILEKLQEAQNDQNFVDELNAQTTVEGLQEVFKKKGIDLTIDQINEIVATVNTNTEEEISEAGLENVSGGIITSGSIWAKILRPGWPGCIPTPIPTFKPKLPFNNRKG